ncbi:hypothetical protein JXB27_01570 [Candidatus Woesearchaeota archaeon]|nr:hypothetical protein [Candidatus Woesearchaeota archaeon]
MVLKKISATITEERIFDGVNNYIASIKGDCSFAFPAKKERPLCLNDKVEVIVRSVPKRGITELIGVIAENRTYYAAKYHK